MDDILKKFQSYVQPILDFKIEVGDGIITPSSIVLSLIILFLFNAFSKVFQRILSQRVVPRFRLEKSTE